MTEKRKRRIPVNPNRGQLVEQEKATVQAILNSLSARIDSMTVEDLRILKTASNRINRNIAYS